MLKLADDLYVLELPIHRGEHTMVLNLSLLLDPERGPTLIDTGFPGQEEAIATLLAEAGVRLAEITRIVLTHQDIDHVGSLAALVKASGARVLAHAIEQGAIDGTVLPRFARPELLAERPELRALAERFIPTPVDDVLEDGMHLDLAGGVRILFTPGHTPGHICLYHERTRTLIAGDALTADAGVLHGPNPSATPDMLTALHSLRNLQALDCHSIVCYHGGVVQQDAPGQLRRVVQTLEVTREGQ